MEKLRQDVKELYQPSGHKKFEENQAAARARENTTRRMPSKKDEEDPFAMSPALVHRR